jgi:ABC-type multidrug transport system permease subunit
MIQISLKIAWKTIVELIREKWVLLIIFLFPVLMIGLYKIAYTDNGQGLSGQMKIGILDQARTSEENNSFNHQLGEYLAAETYENLRVYSMTEYASEDAAKTALYGRQINALAILDPTFSQKIETGKQAKIQILGNTYSSQFVFTQTFLLASLEGFNAQISTESGINSTPLFQTNYVFLEGSGGISDLDFGLPGIMVFSLMFLTMSTAQILVREKSNKTFLRYRLSNISPAVLFGGLMLSQMALALLLMPFILLVSSMMGVQIRSGIGSLLLVGCILSISAIGIGLIVACFTKNESEAINIGASIVVPMVLMSNSLYPLEKTPMFQFLGQNVSFYDFLPTSVASDLLRSSLIYVQSLAENQFWLVWLSLQALIIFLIGAFLFNHFLYRDVTA